jgi:hypothetical protein
MILNKELIFIRVVNLIYLILGISIYYIATQNVFDIIWFCVGWGFMFFNFELLKKIFLIIFEIFKKDKKEVIKISPFVYILLLTKILIWGILFLYLAKTTNIREIPLVIGILTILFSSLVLGIKELLYART